MIIETVCADKTVESAGNMGTKYCKLYIIVMIGQTNPVYTQANASPIITKNNNIIVRHKIAVSYTHLDVYKRQVVYKFML